MQIDNLKLFYFIHYFIRSIKFRLTKPLECPAIKPDFGRPEKEEAKDLRPSISEGAMLHTRFVVK